MVVGLVVEFERVIIIVRDWQRPVMIKFRDYSSDMPLYHAS